MNKLTEIKQKMNATDVLEKLGLFMDTEKEIYADMRYLLSLLEEKDKALTSAEWAIEHMLREQPNEMWTNEEVKSWESFGVDSLKEIKIALNTSSNNEGE